LSGADTRARGMGARVTELTTVPLMLRWFSLGCKGWPEDWPQDTQAIVKR
jgi:hypothetical protein